VSLAIDCIVYFILNQSVARQSLISEHMAILPAIKCNLFVNCFHVIEKMELKHLLLTAVNDDFRKLDER